MHSLTQLPASLKLVVDVHMNSSAVRKDARRDRRFLDKKDARLMGNMRKHVKSCWGEDALNAADDAKDADEVRAKIVGSILKNGSIAASFERKGKGKLTYSHRQHTRGETR